MLITLAQNNTGGAAAGIAGMIVLLIYLAIIVLVIAGMWKMFTKAGQPGWAAIIPILTLYFLCKIAGRPGWWLILMLIPIVSLVIMIIVMLDLAKSFGKGVGFAIGLILLGFIFWSFINFFTFCEVVDCLFCTCDPLFHLASKIIGQAFRLLAHLLIDSKVGFQHHEDLT